MAIDERVTEKKNQLEKKNEKVTYWIGFQTLLFSFV